MLLFSFSVQRGCDTWSDRKTKQDRAGRHSSLFYTGPRRSLWHFIQCHTVLCEMALTVHFPRVPHSLKRFTKRHISGPRYFGIPINGYLKEAFILPHTLSLIYLPWKMFLKVTGVKNLIGRTSGVARYYSMILRTSASCSLINGAVRFWDGKYPCIQLFYYYFFIFTLKNIDFPSRKKENVLHELKS